MDLWRSNVDDAGLRIKRCVGYDRASGELVRTISDASGTYAIVRSPGWKGDTLVLDGNAKSAAGTMRVRETIRRLSENELGKVGSAARRQVERLRH